MRVNVLISVAPESSVVVVTTVWVSVAIMDESLVRLLASNDLDGELVVDPKDSYSRTTADRVPNEGETFEFVVEEDFSCDKRLDADGAPEVMLMLVASDIRLDPELPAVAFDDRD